MYVHHVRNYRIIRIRSECIQDVLTDHYVILDMTEARPPAEVSLPREADDVVQKTFEILLDGGRLCTSGDDS